MSMEYYYRFSGVELAVEVPEGLSYPDHGHLAPFRVDRVSNPHRFVYELVDELPPPEETVVATFPGFRVYAREGAQVYYIGAVEQSWRGAYMQAAHQGYDHRVLMTADRIGKVLGAHTVLNAIGPERLLAQAEGMILHASFVSWNGRGILFTAPSGTGKSTQAELWRKYREGRILNGDRVALRLTGQGVLAEGIPFAGSSQYCENGSVPPAAIVYLKQAPENRISRLQGAAAFLKLWEGTSLDTWDKEQLEQVSHILTRVIWQVPVYLLECTPDERAVITLEQALKGAEL